MHWVLSIPLYVNSRNFLGFTNAITKCSQLHPNGPLVTRKTQHERNKHEADHCQLDPGEAESILTVDEYATAACTGVSLS